MIERHLADLVAAEQTVNRVYFEWRAGTLTVLDEELDAMFHRWRALQEGEELVVEWRRER